MDFVDDNHLDKSSLGKCLKDRSPGVACGRLWPNKQVDDHVVGLLVIRVEGQKTLDDQTLIFVLVLVTMVSLCGVFYRDCAFNLIRGETEQWLFINDHPLPMEEAGELSNAGLAVGRALGNNEDCVVVADAVMGCNILEWTGGGDANYFFGGGTKHLK